MISNMVDKLPPLSPGISSSLPTAGINPTSPPPHSTASMSYFMALAEGREKKRARNATTTMTTTPTNPPIVKPSTKKGENELFSEANSTTTNIHVVNEMVTKAVEDGPLSMPAQERESSKSTKVAKNPDNYVVVDANALGRLESLGSVGVTVKDLNNATSPNNTGGGGEGSGGGPQGQKLRMNPSRAAKLAKILSVVEEGSDSPVMDRKYEIVTNQV